MSSQPWLNLWLSPWVSRAIGSETCIIVISCQFVIRHTDHACYTCPYSCGKLACVSHTYVFACECTSLDVTQCVIRTVSTQYYVTNTSDMSCACVWLTLSLQSLPYQLIVACSCVADDVIRDVTSADIFGLCIRWCDVMLLCMTQSCYDQWLVGSFNAATFTWDI